MISLIAARFAYKLWKRHRLKMVLEFRKGCLAENKRMNRIVNRVSIYSNMKREIRLTRRKTYYWKKKRLS